ncbi:hypothetical protein THMIRHAM_21000 [Thiomicrorhabdus immobilis]|uniref:Uncharacterized protein n=1 Tax=Thiomicrorhabdus immobilis TaxID=2791037 RepID=A0ABN6CYV9_9GAMM|nr:hypothetical protein [Thiomicrorhabdus immobilis]BCN94315.1 hypothetical protein THMIRHAM_21000 [Thiomicrorhabdus immobilis]
MPFLRIIMLGLSALAAVFLVVSVSYSVQQWQKLQSSQQQYLAAERKVRMISELEQQLPEFQNYQNTLLSIQSGVSKNALKKEDWSSKSVIVKNSIISRQDVSGFLKGISNKEAQWFKPKQFALKTMSEKDDLFHWTAKSSNQLNLLLEGEYMIRRPL